MSKLKERRPSPAMVVALIALFVALAGTAYAAQSINGGSIQKQTIGGGKLKQKTLTGYQINPNVAGRDNAGTTVPNSGYAQTNISPANPNAVEVHTRDKAGANEDADFHLIVVCP
jgi:hypothetical protein